MVVAGQAQGDGDRGDAFRGESGFDAVRSEQVPRQQAGHHEQHQTDGDLQRNQCLAQAPPAVPQRPGVNAAGELAQHARPRAGPRRHQAGRDAGGHGRGDRHREHPAVQRQIERNRHQQRHADGGESLEKSPGQRDAAGHAEQRQHHALDEQLPQQASPARPDRETQADLPPPRRCPRQQEPRDVRTGDQQHQADQHEQAERSRAQAILEHRMGRHVARRDDGHAEPLVRIGVILLQRLHYAVQVIGGAGGGVAVPESPLHEQPAESPALQPGGSGRGRSVVHHRGLDVVDPGHRHPEPRREDGRRQASEAFRRHADDGVGTTADPERSSNDCRIVAEQVGPQPGRDHHHRDRAGPVVFRQQRAPLRRRNTQHLKVVARDRLAGQRTGPVTDSDRPYRGNVAQQPGEGSSIAMQVQVVGIRAAVPGEAVHVAGVDVDELLRSIDRQPPQERGVQQREERRVETDADREGDGRHRRQCRVFPDEPQRVDDVLMKGVELPDTPALPAVVLDDIHLAELEPRSPPGFPG